MLNTNPIFLTSVKAIDGNGDEHPINVRVQKNDKGDMIAEFGYPERLLTLNLSVHTNLAIGRLHVPVQYVDKLKKFCTL